MERLALLRYLEHHVRLKLWTGLKRAPDAQVGSDLVADHTAAVASPRGAGADRKARKVASKNVGGDFGAGRRLDRVGAERARPGLTGIGEDRRVNGVQEDRPGADAALRPRQRPAVLSVQERDVTAGERVLAEAAQEAERAGAEVDDA